MADVTALALSASSDRSISVSFTSANVADTLTFANLAALLANASTIKSFLTASYGSVASTMAALGSKGASLSLTSSVTGNAVQVSADKTLAGFAAGDHILRIALAHSISS